MSALTIAVPGILDAPRSAQGATPPESPAFRRIMVSASSVTRGDTGGWDWLGDELRIPRQNDTPVAPVWARAAGVDVRGDFWLNATPVTMEIGRTDVRLAAAAPQLDARESDALLAAINAHFAGDGLVLAGPRPGAWFVRVAPPPALITRPPEVARTRGVRESLPVGEDSARWRRWQNEIQMLLFEHPVNAVREARGAPPVNSIWFWGGGVLPQATTSIDLALATDDPAVAALGEFAGSRILPIARLDDALAGNASRTLVLVAQLRSAAADDVIASTVERVLSQRRYDHVDVVLTGVDRNVRLGCKRPNLWRRLVGAPEPPTYDALFAQWGIERNAM